MSSAELTSEQTAALQQSSLSNDDLAPAPVERRTWTMWNIAALWVGMSVCIPTYMLASGCPFCSLGRNDS